MLAVASAQHYGQNDYYQHQQPQYHQYQAAPAVVKTVQPALIKSYQPAVVKQLVQPALVKQVAYAEAPANYEFNYDVHDSHTGDIKQQHEVAKDGAISGQYSLIDADGYRRIVDYTADDHHGFQANVRREPVEGHKIIKEVQPTIIKKIVAQPAIAVQKYVAPAPQYQSYSAPAPQYHQQQYSAPQYQSYSAPAPQYHQQQQYYSAPAQVKVAVAQPIAVQKYVAPVQQYVAQAPQYHSYSAPAQVVKAVAQPIKYSNAEHSSHVTFNGPSSNYHY
jgi:hypothetical protein